MKKSIQKFRGIIFTLWPIWVGITWFLLAFVFHVVEQPGNGLEFLGIFSLGAYRVIGVFFLLSIVLIPLGIYMWIQSNKKEGAKIGEDLVMDPIRFGWKAMKKYFWFWVGLLIVVFGITQGYGGWVGNEFAFTKVKGFIWTRDILISLSLLRLVEMLIGTFFNIPILTSSLRAVDGKKMSWKKSFSKIDLLWKFLIGTILYMLIVFGGTILFIIPGIYRAVRFQFFNLLIIDKGYGPIKALKESRRITEGYFWDAFMFSFAIGMIVVFGALAFLVGLFAALPTLYIAQAKFYRVLKEKRKKNH